MESEIKIIGQAWIKNGFRPIYSIKKFKKGKNKNKVEVTYRKGKGFKKIKIFIDQVDLFDTQETENHDV